MPFNVCQTDAWLSFRLDFVGGYGDAASFVLAKTFTGHVTGNLVLGAIAVAAHDWRATIGHLSAIVTFLLSRDCPEYAYRAPPQGVAIMAVVSYHHGDKSDSDSDRFFGVGISVHTTYLTGMILKKRRYANHSLQKRWDRVGFVIGKILSLLKTQKTPIIGVVPY